MADLALSIGATPDAVKRGKPLDHTLTVVNAGPSNALGVVLTDTLPSESRFVGATPSQGSCVTPPPGQTGDVTCRLGFLANTREAAAEVVVRIVVRKTEVSNTASAPSATTDPNSTNNTATIVTPVR